MLAEVIRRRGFHHSLQSLLDGYVESDPATASKRFMRVVALLEHNTMQSVYDAIIASKQRDTDDPAMIALILEHTERPNDPDDDPLRVFDCQESPTDECDLYQEKFASREDLQLNDLD